MRSTLLKYKLLRLRCKISFEAFVRFKTVSELVIMKVKDTFNDLVSLNEFLLPYEQLIVKDDKVVDHLVNQTMTNLLSTLFRMNNELLIIREYMDSQADKQKAAFKLYVQRENLTKTRNQILQEPKNKTEIEAVESDPNKYLRNQWIVSKFRKEMKSDIFMAKENPNKLEGESAQAQMKYKNQMHKLKMRYDKVKFILSMRACRPSILLQLQLEKIKLAKKMFILELE